MNVLQALILGIVQGIAEFLPISSSGHLSIFSEFLNLGDVPILFDILLHIATLGSVFIVFRKKIAELLVSLFVFLTRRTRKAGATDASGKAAAADATDNPGAALMENAEASGTGEGLAEDAALAASAENADTANVRRDGIRDEKTLADVRTILALIIATAGTGALGFLLKDFAETLSPFFISCLFVVTGVLLILSGKIKRKTPTETVTPKQALAIGLAQGIGVLPGLSRSGVTISAALLSGVNRSHAGEFSFLLSIPAIIAAFIFELKDADTLAGTVPLASLAVGMAAAFVSGLLSLKFLLRLINRGKLGWFACYLIPAGILLAVYFALH